MWRRNIVRILRGGVALAVLLSVALSMPATPAAGADSLSDMQSKLQRLQNEEKTIKSKLAGAKNDLSKQQEYSDSLLRQIENTQGQIDLLEGQIALLDADLAQKEAGIRVKEGDIQTKTAEMETAFERLRMRLRALSKEGQLTVLQMLLRTDDYVDMLTQAGAAARVAQSDQALLDSIEAQLVALKDEKAALEAQQQSLAADREKVKALRTQSDTKKRELDAQYGESRKLLDDLKKKQTDLNDQLKKTQKELDQLEDKIQKAIRDAKPNAGSYAAGTMSWPVPTVRVISSGYGFRWGKLHRGIDISNGSAYGENIVAAADGVVILANKTDSWGMSYGYYLIVDHGNDAKGRRISTLYAHCSKILVNTGDTVKGGQTVLGKIGSTGNSTGPHLHFEVRVDGTAVDPIANGYVKKGS